MLSHERLGALVAYYLRTTGATIGASDHHQQHPTAGTDAEKDGMATAPATTTTATGRAAGGCTPFNHVRLL